MFLIEDSCGTNKTSVTTVNITFIGCGNHSFILALQDTLEEIKHLLKKLNELMKHSIRSLSL